MVTEIEYIKSHLRNIKIQDSAYERKAINDLEIILKKKLKLLKSLKYDENQISEIESYFSSQ